MSHSFPIGKSSQIIDSEAKDPGLPWRGSEARKNFHACELGQAEACGMGPMISNLTSIPYRWACFTYSGWHLTNCSFVCF